MTRFFISLFVFAAFLSPSLSIAVPSYDVVTITNNSHQDWYPNINDNSDIVWITGTGEDGNWYNEVMFYTNGSAEKISIDDSYYYIYPKINNSGQAVWSGSKAGSEGIMAEKAVFFYDGSETTKLFEYINDRNIDVNLNDNGHVVWNRLNDAWRDVYLYNGLDTVNITNSFF